MDRLFSPWRSQYIASFSDQKKKEADECLFCRISKEKKDKKNFVILRGKYCFVVMNLYPYNSGHLMVVPYRHTDDLSKLTSKENAEILSTTSRMIDLLKKAIGPHGFNLGTNLGRVAGAGIDQHLHFHIVPRWNGDTNFMPVLADTRVISEAMEETYKKLTASLKK